MLIAQLSCPRAVGRSHLNRHTDWQLEGGALCPMRVADPRRADGAGGPRAVPCSPDDVSPCSSVAKAVETFGPFGCAEVVPEVVLV